MALNSPMAPWTAIIPVRSLTASKSRLQGAPGNPADFTAAFLSDVADACRTSENIEHTIVVTPSGDVAELAETLGCAVHRESDATGINEAINQARTIVDANRPVIAILGDTPCLTGAVLDVVIATANDHPVSFVPDAAGTGSTMWCARDSTASPHFGQHSRARHRQAGATELGTKQASPTWARARRDVDTPVDLWDAVRLGVGPATLRAIQDNQTASHI